MSFASRFKSAVLKNGGREDDGGKKNKNVYGTLNLQRHQCYASLADIASRTIDIWYVSTLVSGSCEGQLSALRLAPVGHPNGIPRTSTQPAMSLFGGPGH